MEAWRFFFWFGYGEHEGAPNIFQEPRALNVFVVDVTVYFVSRTEQLEYAIVKNYRELHQLHDQKRRSFCVILHYHRHFQRAFKVRGIKRRKHAVHREAKKRKLQKS